MKVCQCGECVLVLHHWHCHQVFESNTIDIDPTDAVIVFESGKDIIRYPFINLKVRDPHGDGNFWPDIQHLPDGPQCCICVDNLQLQAMQ
jgi:hypothetical protein